MMNNKKLVSNIFLAMIVKYRSIFFMNFEECSTGIAIFKRIYEYTNFLSFYQGSPLPAITGKNVWTATFQTPFNFIKYLAILITGFHKNMNESMWIGPLKKRNCSIKPHFRLIIE